MSERERRSCTSRDAQGATGPSGFIHPGGGAAAGCSTRPSSAATAAEDALEDARGGFDSDRPRQLGARPRQMGARPCPVGRPPALQLAVVFKRALGSELQFYSSDKGGAFLLVIGGGTSPSAITFRHRPPRGRLRWSLLRLISGGDTCPPLSFRWSPWDPGGCRRTGPLRRWCPPSVQEATKIKSPSLFQVENNKISRDVKGLFLGVRFISSRIISVIIRLQLEDELHVQVGCSVRGVKGLLGLNPLGLISRSLRGQVNLSI